jgi:hypothetical protein
VVSRASEEQRLTKTNGSTIAFGVLQGVMLTSAILVSISAPVTLVEIVICGVHGDNGQKIETGMMAK